MAACLLALALAAEPVSAGDPLRLSHRFRPGDELVYTFSSKLRQLSTVSGEKLTYQMTLAGATRQTVIDVAPDNGPALFGLTGTGTWTMVSGPGGISGTTRDQIWVSAYRVMPDGKIVPRATRPDDRKQNLIHRTMNQVSENAQIFPAFPDRPLAPRDRWEGHVLLPLPGIRQPGKATATIADVTREGGSTCYHVKCDIYSEKGQSFATYQSSINRPDIEIKGTSSGLFDVDRGVWVRTQVHLVAKLSGPSFDGAMEVDGRTDLSGFNRPSDDDFRTRSAAIRGLESAIAKLYEDDTEAAEEMLGRQASGSNDPQWKAGLATTLGLIETVRKELAADKGDGHAAASPQTSLLAEADKAAQDSDWKGAAEKYERVAKQYPGTEEAIQALTAAADLYEHKLDRKSAANSLRRKVVDMREQMAERRKSRTGDALSLYKQAGAYETAGELRKATESFESFLGAGTNGIPPQTRLLARYRLGGLYEKLGDLAKATNAYTAVTTEPADDDYSMKLKAKAREKLESKEPKP